jgi:hypothetical protein
MVSRRKKLQRNGYHHTHSSEYDAVGALSSFETLPILGEGCLTNKSIYPIAVVEVMVNQLVKNINGREEVNKILVISMSWVIPSVFIRVCLTIGIPRITLYISLRNIPDRYR